MIPMRISSPTCEELGIPPQESTKHVMHVQFNRPIKNHSLHLDGLRYQATITKSESKLDPFSPLCMIPLPNQFTYNLEPSLIRKRNERERERVKCVNDGYARLREHLPMFRKGKRVSKVDTLRGAIDYIRHLENLLSESEMRNDFVENPNENVALLGEKSPSACNNVNCVNMLVASDNTQENSFSDCIPSMKREYAHSA